MGVFSTAAIGGENIAAPLLYNEIDFDFQRNNVEGTALVSASRTVQTTSADLTNPNARGVLLFLNVTVAGAAGGLTLRILVKDPISGALSVLNAAPTAFATTGVQAILVYPGAAALGGNILQYVAQALPRTWRVRIDVGSADAYTYSVGYCLIN